MTLGKTLLNETEGGFNFLLSDKFNQDPLEEYFSKKRRRLGSNENPTLQEVNRNTLGLNVAGDDLIRVMNGNTRGRNRELIRLDIRDESALPQKRAKR